MMQAPMSYGTDRQPGPVHDNPRLPEDLGMSSLGLVMQLSGWVMVCLWSMSLVALALASRALGGSNPTGAIIGILLLSIVRSIWGAVAGGRLVGGGPDGMAAVRGYAIAAGVHSVLVVVIAAVAGGSKLQATFFVWLLLVSLAWPAVVFGLCIRSDARALEQSFVQPRDCGIAGAGALMTMLGTIGVLLGILLLVNVVPLLQLGFTGVLLFLVVVALLVRSAFHVAAGIASVRGDSAASFQVATGRYAGIGLAATAFAVVVAFLVALMAGRGGSGLLQIVVLMPVAGALAVWPAIVARLRTQVAMRASSDQLPRARDNGLTALGFMLLGQGVFGLVFALGGLMFEGGGGRIFSGVLPGIGGAAADSAIPVPVTVAAAAIGTWGGFELSFMTPRYQIAGIATAVTGTVVGIWNAVVVFGALGGGSRRSAFGMLGGDGGLSLLMPVVVAGASLVLPLLTLGLCLRRLPGDDVVKPEVFS